MKKIVQNLVGSALQESLVRLSQPFGVRAGGVPGPLWSLGAVIVSCQHISTSITHTSRSVTGVKTQFATIHIRVCLSVRIEAIEALIDHVLVAFFNFLTSLVAQVDRVFVLVVFDRRP